MIRSFVLSVAGLSIATQSSYADDGYWSLPEQTSAEISAAADLYAVVEYIPDKPVVRSLNTETSAFAMIPTSFEKGSPEDLILSFIGHLEAPRGYDDYYSQALPAPSIPVTTMTISQVRNWQSTTIAWQRSRGRQNVSSAVGRYQIVSTTMDVLINDLRLSGDEIFDGKLQDRMAMVLMHKAGWMSFKAGSLSIETFGTALAEVWAALPALSGPKRGKSVYHGFAGNRALVSLAAYKTHLDKVSNALGTRVVREAAVHDKSERTKAPQ